MKGAPDNPGVKVYRKKGELLQIFICQNIILKR
jgi:hypothetical protein